MPLNSADLKTSDAIWERVRDLDRSEGSGAHPLLWHLANPATQLRDLADAMHFLCLIHGNHPGLFDLALANGADPLASQWLTTASDNFHTERAFLVALSAAAGPPPSTPAHAESETAVTAQRHALEMLSRSDRAGCATGAAIALALEWPIIRQILDSAARRLEIDVPPLAMPPESETASLMAAMATTAPVERAMLFGFRQVLAQHRGLWELLEARVDARERA
ncbi:DUF6975 family protein [Stakelama flava]|nr:hypothetical protein [Stakelama flava]